MTLILRLAHPALVLALAAAACGDAPQIVGLPDPILEDPGLADRSAWETSPGLDFHGGLREGAIDSGFITIDAREASCEAREIAQTVTMPAYDPGAPLVLAMHVIGDDVIRYGDRSIGDVRIDDVVYGPTTLTHGSDTTRTCVPAAMHGRVGRLALTFACDGLVGALDRIGFVPAEPGECPVLGMVGNGDFEGEVGFRVYRERHFMLHPEEPDALVEGVGVDSSRGLALMSEEGCFRDLAVGALHVPLATDIASPAFTLWARGDGVTSLGFGVDGEFAERVVPSAEGGRFSVCIPEGLGGIILPLTMSVGVLPSMRCFAPGDAATVHVDDLRIVDDPSCAD